MTISESEKILLEKYIRLAIEEDQTDPAGKIPTGDHSALSSIGANKEGKAKLLVKSEGILAGVELAKMICDAFGSDLVLEQLMEDGTAMKTGDIAFFITGKERSILGAERIILNCMQRMSGIATLTNSYSKLIAGTNARLLDTRKTTPNFRVFEKWAVRIGGGHNHRFGLYDMIMLKDNHIDYCGGVAKALLTAKNYQEANKLNLKVEIETRNLYDVKDALETGFCDRIMFDNFSVENTYKAVELVSGKVETESSGGINKETIRSYAETGVDFISVGALTHSSVSLDLSLKAVI
jgi:nicotinate-nucleotide pyrophosphorylase (carboxylating)